LIIMPSPFALQRVDLTPVTPASVDEAADAVRSAASAGRAVLVRGGGTKWSIGLQPRGEALLLSTAGLRGILEYDPGELTFTARAGTPLAEIQAALAEKGQYLPFDPPFAGDGATLGGTVAAGLAGPRRLRYGGLRDFILGIEYLDSAGVRTRSGGKVVKNAANYDFPKLFCGSLGTLGVLTRVSFKVFPAPEGSRTLLASLKSASEAQTMLHAVDVSQAQISAADVWTSGLIADVPPMPDAYMLAVQVDGAHASLDSRLQTLQKLLPAGSTAAVLDGGAEAQLWASLRDLAWLGSDEAVLRIYLPSNRVSELDAKLAEQGARRAFSLAGNVCWAAFNGSANQLVPALSALGLRAAVWRSKEDLPEVIPALPGAAMVERVKAAFDPQNVFYPGRYAAG
jgi:glycolate oxidase FAD binding subunit